MGLIEQMPELNKDYYPDAAVRPKNHERRLRAGSCRGSYGADKHNIISMVPFVGLLHL